MKLSRPCEDRTAISEIRRVPSMCRWSWTTTSTAELIWSRLGNVGNYCEPFAGSLAVLLARPHEPRIETVNDVDVYLANFWRSVGEAIPREGGTA